MFLGNFQGWRISLDFSRKSGCNMTVLLGPREQRQVIFTYFTIYSNSCESELWKLLDYKYDIYLSNKKVGWLVLININTLLQFLHNGEQLGNHLDMRFNACSVHNIAQNAYANIIICIVSHFCVRIKKKRKKKEYQTSFKPVEALFDYCSYVLGFLLLKIQSEFILNFFECFHSILWVIPIIVRD